MSSLNVMQSPAKEKESPPRADKRSTMAPRSPRPDRAERSISASTPGHRTRMNDRSTRVRQRQRSVSPSRAGGGSRGASFSEDEDAHERRRTRLEDRIKKKSKDREGRRRPRRRSTESEGTVEFTWGRGSKSPPVSSTPGRRGKQPKAPSSQQQQLPAPPLTEEGGSEEIQFNASFGEFNNSPSKPTTTDTSRRSSKTDKKKKEKRTSTTQASAEAANTNIDTVIAQFRDACDMHMATLLDLKNDITNTQKAVTVESEKEKEHQQVRQWYSALAEKHTKLQKEHQDLKEDHAKLQEKYNALKRASTLTDSFVAHFEEGNKEEKKKEKKEGGKKALDVVWSRAGKMAGKVHQKLKE